MCNASWQLVQYGTFLFEHMEEHDLAEDLFKRFVKNACCGTFLSGNTANKCVYAALHRAILIDPTCAEALAFYAEAVSAAKSPTNLYASNKFGRA